MTISFLLLAAAAAAAPEAKSPDETICKRTQLTTTRMGSAQKVCMTRAEWDERTRRINHAAGEVKISGPNRTNATTHGSGLPPPPGGGTTDLGEQ
ncbi:MAG: hypothetical protein ACK40O_08125 [Allosphingosinicella sp.]